LIDTLTLLDKIASIFTQERIVVYLMIRHAALVHDIPALRRHVVKAFVIAFHGVSLINNPMPPATPDASTNKGVGSLPNQIITSPTIAVTTHTAPRLVDASFQSIIYLLLTVQDVMRRFHLSFFLVQ